MKVITLCREGSCCPVVRVMKDKVAIGEKGNTCVLTMEQWQTLKDKVLRKEI